MPFAFHTLSRADFPLTVEFWEAGADRRGPATWSTTIAAPGALHVPRLGPGTWTRLTFPDRQEIEPPPGGRAEDF